VVGNELVFSYKMIDPDAAKLDAKFRDQVSGVKRWANNQQGQIDEFNTVIARTIFDKAESRKGQLLAASKAAATLSYPVRQSPNPLAAADSQTGQAVKPGRGINARQAVTTAFDVFISHASEDKAEIARPLFEALTAKGVSVWFDEAVLVIGDSLRRKIDAGLTHRRFGVVILSPSFLAKEWPQRELDGLTARETASGEKAILPVWHKLDKDRVMKYSPVLADRLAARTDEGIQAVAEEILKALGK
jgi:hypothetical protein